jgi:tetratricopeptide (TPR) repeat protein
MKNQLLLSVLIMTLILPLFALKAIADSQPAKAPPIALIVRSAPADENADAKKEKADIEQSVMSQDDPGAQKTETPIEITDLSEEADKKTMDDPRARRDYSMELYNMGVSHNSTGRHQEAVAAFKQAINLKPDYVDAHYNLGLSYLMLGDNVSALEQYKVLKTLNPEEADNLRIKALAIAALNTESRYILQVGAYRKIENAHEMLGKLESDYLLAHIEKINNLNKVRIRGIKTRYEANRVMSDIRKRFKIKPFLIIDR